jgi:hypothetical protein
MYHDTIHIKFRYNKVDDIEFDYSFLISKTSQIQFSSINYGILLGKFDEIGFNLKYLKFNDLDLTEDVYCTYNFQSNFNVFFSAYKKLIHKKDFSIKYEYGNMINGIFYQNNMTTFSSVTFVSNVSKIKDLLFKEIDIIRDKTFFKTVEAYQIIDKDGMSIAFEVTDADSNFEQKFFDKYEVVVALRKYKLNKIMQFED